MKTGDLERAGYLPKTALILAGVLGAACSSDAAAPSNDPSPASRPEPDEHGVRVAGGETSDFGSATSSEPDACRPVETTALSVEEALGLGLPIDGVLSILDEPFEAPFHWGYRCDGEMGAGSAPDALLSIQAELVTVYRTTRTPLPDQPAETVCNDRLEYRAVISLETDDDRIAGRFYARISLNYTVDETIVMRATPDARNFSGSLSFPVDLDRPHFSAVIANLSLREEGSFGSLDIEVNYTDEDPSLFPERHGAGGFWPAEAHDGEGGLRLPASDGTFYNPTFYVPELPLCREPALAPPGSDRISLAAYPGSNEPPTCIVEPSFFGQGEYGSFTARDYVPPDTDYPRGALQTDLEVNLSIDGTPMAVRSPWSVPFSLGRLPVGTHIAIETRSNNPAFMPFAALSIDGYGDTGYDQFDFCQPVGCVARVEDTVTGYCER